MADSNEFIEPHFMMDPSPRIGVVDVKVVSAYAAQIYDDLVSQRVEVKKPKQQWQVRRSTWMAFVLCYHVVRASFGMAWSGHWEEMNMYG